MGNVAFAMGEFRKSEQLHRAAAESDSRVPAVVRGHSLVRRGHALWYLGFPDQALALAKESLRLAGDTDDPYMYPVVLNWTGINHMLCGELGQAGDLFRKSLNLCTERGYLMVGALNLIGMGLVSVACGQALAGLEQLHRGIEGSAPFPASLAFEQRLRIHGYHLALGLAAAGRPDEALSALIPAIEWAEQSGLTADLAPMHALKGRLLEAKNRLEEAENSFRTSIEIARRQGAKSLELGATTSLARLLARQDRRDEACAMLAEIYGGFTEGFDTRPKGRQGGSGGIE